MIGLYNILLGRPIPAVRLTCIACFSPISQSILNQFWWNFRKDYFRVTRRLDSSRPLPWNFHKKNYVDFQQRPFDTFYNLRPWCANRTCRVRVVIPTGRYSDRSIFRQVVIPTGRYSDKQVVIPTGRSSDRSIFRQVVISTGLYSDKQVVIPTGRYSDRSITRQTGRYSESSIFRQTGRYYERSLFRQVVIPTKK